MRRLIEMKRIASGYTPVEVPDQAGLLTAQNVRMHLGGIEKRTGMSQFGNVPNTNRVIELATSVFPTGQNLWRFGGSTIHRYNSGTQQWDAAIPGGLTISTTRWAHLNMFNTFYCSPGYIMDVPNVAGIFKQDTLGGALSVVNNSPGTMHLISYAGRQFAIGTRELDGELRFYRVMWTPAGMPDTWNDPDAGSGYLDLTEAPHPPLSALIIAGRLVILTGDPTGGSIIYGTATVDPDFPVSFETAHGIGLLARRTLVRAASDFALFMGHDNFYGIQGTQPQPIGDPVSAKAVQRINVSRTEEAFAVYSAGTNDVTFVIPVNTSGLEAYTFNLRTKVWAGPDPVPNWSAHTLYQFTDVTTWATLKTAGTKWRDLVGKAWSAFSRSSGPALPLYGTSDGKVLLVRDGVYADAGSAIECILETGDYDMDGESFKAPSSRYPVQCDPADEKMVDGLFFRYKGDWTPKVEISTNGGQTWTHLFTTNFPGNMGMFSDKMITFPAVTGRQFRLRITHSSASETFLLSKVALSAMWLRRPRV